jgi:hypothetical protein
MCWVQMPTRIEALERNWYVDWFSGKVSASYMVIVFVDV